MVRTLSTMLSLGTTAPAFSLPDPEGNLVSLDARGDARAVLVIFLCNHCPYVKHIRQSLSALCREYQSRETAIFGINANDAGAYPDDAPEKMRQEIKEAGYTFPYLVDADQETAKKYRAACTPDFYVFDSSLRLIYRGQMDDSRPGNDIPVTGSDLRAALDAVLKDHPVPALQKPSMGCNIKWQPGNAPDYFSG